jgi:hypothetical protein
MVGSPGRDLNPVPPEYEAGALTTRPKQSCTMASTRNSTFRREDYIKLDMEESKV